MRRLDMDAVWGNSIVLAICFFGWIGLAWLCDGIADKAQAEVTFWQAVLFSSVMAGASLFAWVFRR